MIGLYLNPPQNALVLSVDEKPSIQALERARGYVQTSSGKIVQGLKSTRPLGLIYGGDDYSAAGGSTWTRGWCTRWWRRRPTSTT